MFNTNKLNMMKREMVLLVKQRVPDPVVTSNTEITSWSPTVEYFYNNAKIAILVGRDLRHR